METKIKSSGIVEGKIEQAVFTVAGILIKTVYVNEGELVEKDDILYELDLDDLQQKIEQKSQDLQIIDYQIQDAINGEKAAMASYELALSQAKDDYDKVVLEGNARVEQTENEFIIAQTNYENYLSNPELYLDQTEEEMISILNEKKIAYEEAVQVYKDSVLIAQRTMDSVSLQVPASSAKNQLEIEKSRIQNDLDKLVMLKNVDGKIKSPIKGVVSQISIRSGSLTSGSDILIKDSSYGMFLTAIFQEKDREFIQKDSKVKISSDNLSIEILDKLKKMRIYSISEVMDTEINSQLDFSKEGKNIEVTVEIPADTLNIGDIAFIEIEVNPKEYNMCIPHGALHQKEKGKYYVNIIDKQGSILGETWVSREVKVELLDQNEKYVAIEGVAQNQEIITKSTKELVDGSRVKRKKSVF